MKRMKENKPKKDYKKARKHIKIILFLSMLVLIYFASPRLAQLVKESANYIYYVDNNIITRIVELILTTIAMFAFMYKKEK